MTTTYTLEDQIDTNDMRPEALPLTVVAEVDYDSFMKRRSVDIKSVTLSYEDAKGKTHEIPMKLTDFRDETLEILKDRIADKFDVAMMNGEEMVG